MTWASPVQKGRRLLNWDVDNITCLLLLPESKKTDARDLDDLEADTGNITLGLAATTETRDEDFVVLIDKVQATIVLCAKNSICVRIFSIAHINRPLGVVSEVHTGTKAVTFFPFLMSCTRTHFRMAELGCLASTPIFSRTMPLACDEPLVGEVL